MFLVASSQRVERSSYLLPKRLNEQNEGKLLKSLEEYSFPWDTYNLKDLQVKIRNMHKLLKYRLSKHANLIFSFVCKYISNLPKYLLLLWSLKSYWQLFLFFSILCSQFLSLASQNWMPPSSLNLLAYMCFLLYKEICLFG